MVATSPLQILDEVIIVTHACVVARFGDRKGLWADALHFVSKGGRLLGVRQHQEISTHCAVAVVKGAGQLHADGDLPIVDKYQGRVPGFAPDEPWRNWLCYPALPSWRRTARVHAACPRRDAARDTQGAFSTSLISFRLAGILWRIAVVAC